MCSSDEGSKKRIFKSNTILTNKQKALKENAGHQD
jgi:hypothetical protein